MYKVESVPFSNELVQLGFVTISTITQPNNGKLREN